MGSEYLLIMKYIITEEQYNLIVEQSDSKFGLERFGYNPKKPETLDKAAEKFNEFNNSLDKHTLLTILQIGTAFIPLVGPLVSMGIGLADAALYLKDGDKKTAGLVAVFSMIPGIGGLAAKLGLGKWSAKALGEIGKKISLGSKLTPSEAQVAGRVAQNKDLILKSMEKIGKDATISTGKQGAKKELVKQSVKKGVGNVAGQMALYGATGLGYSKTYDFIQKNTPKVKSSKEGLDWKFVRDAFGSNGSAEDNKLLNLAWDSGWRPGQIVPEKFQLQKYKHNYKQETDNLEELQKLLADIRN